MDLGTCERCRARGVQEPPPATTMVRDFQGVDRNVCEACAAAHHGALAYAEEAGRAMVEGFAAGISGGDDFPLGFHHGEEPAPDILDK